MRKYYLDNVRWLVIILVLVFHDVSIYSSCGALMSYNAHGIAAMDAIGYFVYPWFMCLMFAVAGISARYSLNHRSSREFIRERAMKLLVPFAAYMVLIGPAASELCLRVNHFNMTEDVFNSIPPEAMFFIKAANGMGPSWFLLQLFMLSVILIIVRRIDKKDKLSELGTRCSFTALLLLYIPVLGAAQVLNVAYTFRNMLYLLMFLMGYYIFYSDSVQDILKKKGPILLILGIILGAAQCYTSFGTAYQLVVNNWLVMLYTWIMVLAVMGCAGRFFNYESPFTAYMSKRSFGIYMFHYVVMVYSAYFMTSVLGLPAGASYILVFLASLAGSILLYEIASRIPVINVLFGLKKRNKKVKA